MLPPLLAVRGKTAALRLPAVAVVGAISASYARSAGTRSDGETITHSFAPMIAW